jgi:predicted dehydrogenase
VNKTRQEKKKLNSLHRLDEGGVISRRRFFATAVSAAAAASSACSHYKTVEVVPRHVIGGPHFVAPSDRLNIAGVGIGGQGRGDLRNLAKEDQNIVALCDVDWDLAAETFGEYPKANRYRDFREMLEKEEKNIDAVVVATPDHMHAPVSLMAMKMGKHVYCEKPLTHTVAEAREMARVAREFKVATQMGNQGQADERVRVLAEYIADGAIGKVRQVHNWCNRPRGGWPWPQAIERPEDKPPVPDNLSWDLWLGVAPKRPYHPAYHPFKWRGWYDFGTGALGDIGCHNFHPIFKVLDLGHPVSIEPYSTELHQESYPLVSMIRYEFPARSEDKPAVTLTWYDGMFRPPRPPELEENRDLGEEGALYVGDDGKILNERIIPESKHRQYDKPPETLPRSIGHFKEFIEACKGGEPAGANFQFASLITQVVMLGNVALKAQRKLMWDPDNMKIIDDEKANAVLTKEYREGWTVL